MSMEHVKQIVSELENEYLHPELIQDNKLHFQCGGKIYRVRMPNQRELIEADRKKNEYEMLLLNSDNTLLLKNLKKKLKEKQDIDIDKLEKELKDFEKDIIKVYEKLNKRTDEDTEGIASDHKEYAVIKGKRDDLIQEISRYTTPAIEVQSENYYMAYLTSVCTEKNVEIENDVVWEREWKSFDDYLERPKSALNFYALGWLTKLMLSIR